VQVLWTSLTRKRHCSAYSIRTEATLRSLGRTGGHKPVNNLQDSHNLVLGWSDGLCHRVRKQHCPGEFSILGRKPQRPSQQSATCTLGSSLLTIALYSILLFGRKPEGAELGQTLQKRGKNIAIACHGNIYDADLILVDLGRNCVDRHSLG